MAPFVYLASQEKHVLLLHDGVADPLYSAWEVQVSSVLRFEFHIKVIGDHTTVSDFLLFYDS